MLHTDGGMPEQAAHGAARVRHLPRLGPERRYRTHRSPANQHATSGRRLGAERMVGRPEPLSAMAGLVRVRLSRLCGQSGAGRLQRWEDGPHNRDSLCSWLHCDRCGANGDRDYMAALNIGAQYLAEQAARRQAEHASRAWAQAGESRQNPPAGRVLYGRVGGEAVHVTECVVSDPVGEAWAAAGKAGLPAMDASWWGAVRLAPQVRPRLADRLPRAAPCGCLSATILTYAHVSRNGILGQGECTMATAARTAQVLRFSVVLEWDEEGQGWAVTVPALPGCVTQGDTKAEALRNAEEAIAGHSLPPWRRSAGRGAAPAGSKSPWRLPVEPPAARTGRGSRPGAFLSLPHARAGRHSAAGLFSWT